jgi:hypothetical protein
MVSFLILADDTIVYDEYSTLARWSKVTHLCTPRIAWCCLFSYFISELRRGGLWACPQLSSYSWWGCEYNMYCCWQKYTFNLLVRSWCIWAMLLSAMVFSRASRRCFSLNLSVGSLTWLTYALRDALSKDIAPGEFWFSNVHADFLLDWALQLMYVTIRSDCYIIKQNVSHAWYRCWTIKALVEAEV